MKFCENLNSEFILGRKENFLAFLFLISALAQAHIVFIDQYPILNLLPYPFLLIYSILMYKSFSTKCLYAGVLFFLALLYFQLRADDIKITFWVYPLVITLFILLKDKIKLKIFELFTTLFSVSITLGVFFWLVSFFFGKSFYLGDCRVGERIFELYPFYVIEYVPFQLFEINRFSSVFDEPGMLGTLSVFVLAAKKFQLGEDYRLIPILVGGIVSASLAFYALAVFYWLFSFQIKFKQIVYLVIIVLVFLLVDKVLDGVLLERILFRLNVSDVSELDNRMSNSFGHIFNHYLQTDNIILGMGHNAHTAFGGGSDGLKVFFYNYGLVGFFY